LSATWVVDSSVSFSWVHRNQATLKTDELLDQVEQGATVVVPALWFSEIANALLVLQRRRILTPEEVRAAFESLSRLRLSVDEEATVASVGKTFELAQKYNLTLYDATYLEIALRRKLPLASRDIPLNAAARKCGLKVL